MPAETNSVNDEIKNEARKVLASKTGMEKVKYFVYYYKWPVIGILIGCLIVGSLVFDFVTRKAPAFQVVVVNGEYEELYDYKSFMGAFAETVDYDKKKEEVILDAGYHVDLHAMDQTNQMTVQKVFLNVAAKDLDVLICDEEFMLLACMQECGADLEELLTKEQFEKYEDYIYWFDYSSIKEEEIVSSNYSDEEEKVEIITGEKLGEGPFCAMSIDISEFAKIKDSGMFPYTDGRAFLIVPANTQHMENVKKFIQYLDEPW